MPGPRRIAWPVAIPCAAFAVGASAIVASAVRGDDGVASLAFAYVLMDVVGLTLSVRAARRPGSTPAERRPWRWITASWILTIVVGAALGSAPADGSADVTVWIGAACRLAQLPVLLIGILRFPADPLSGPQRLKLVLDVTTVVGGGFIVIWFFLVGPALARTGDLNSGSLVALGFLAGDLALIFVVCAVLLRGRGNRAGRPLTALLGGVVLHLGADVFASSDAVYLGTLVADARRLPPMALTLLAGLFLTALAAGLQCRRPDETAPARPAGAAPGRTVLGNLPYLALAVGYGFLIAAVPGTPYPWSGLVAGTIVMTGAVTVRQWIALRENRRLANTDLLTGLANRGRLAAELHQAAGRPGAAVLLFDLDGFKDINDTHGHETGDRVLVEFARVLRREVPGPGVVARLGGDEFAAVLRGTDARGAVDVARRIVAGAGGIVLGDVVRGVRTSVGIAPTEPGLTATDLLHRADVAMYRAKRAGAHGWAVHTADDAAGAADGRLAEEFRTALSAGEVTVAYQPVVDLSDGRVVAVEAVSRWWRAGHGPVPADVLVPLAERLGLTGELGDRLLATAAGQLRTWQTGLPPGHDLHLHVTLPPGQVRDAGLAARVAAVLRRTGLAPADLVLSVAESDLGAGGPTFPVLAELRTLGVRIAVDRVGTDYSALRHLGRLPLDVITLDRTAVADLDGAPGAAAVTEAVIRLGQTLALRVVARGVATRAQADRLRALGCHAGYRHPALDAETVAGLLPIRTLVLDS
jgi:diguanylate cyclase (GGDEF)-like protein